MSWNQIISSAKPIYVEWIDAASHGGTEWVPSEDTMEYIVKEPPIMKSVGWLLHNSGRFIVITDTIGPEESSSVHSIPYEMVKAITLLSSES